MNGNYDHESEFERRLRTLPADETARPEHRDALRQQALASFDRARQVREQSRAKRILFFGSALMKRPLSRYVAAAAIVLVVLAWLFWPGSNGAALALSRMIDAVTSAQSARFVAVVQVEGQPQQSFKTAFLAPAKYRIEMSKAVNISDFEAAKMLTLIPEQKQAVVFQLKNAPKDKVPDNFFESLRRLLQAQRGQLPAYERLGEKTIAGRRALGFRLESPIGTLTLWGDPKTGHPIRIENAYTGVPRTETVMTDFEMNVELKAELFALTIPKDFKVQTFDIDASTPKEQDFVESLRVCATLSGGNFPEALDTQSVMKLMIGAMLRDKKDSKKDSKKEAAITQKLMTQAMQIGRGFQFALSLPAGSNAHYAGKGAKKDTKDRPIFWYRPEGSTRYRVIDATLAVRDADQAPRIDGAVPLRKKTAEAK